MLIWGLAGIGAGLEEEGKEAFGQGGGSAPTNVCAQAKERPPGRPNGRHGQVCRGRPGKEAFAQHPDRLRGA